MTEYLAVIGNKASSYDNKTVRKYAFTSEWENATFGKQSIPSKSECICEWRIRINDGYTNNLGVSSGNAIPNEAVFRRKNDYNYCYTAYIGQKMSSHNIEDYGESFRKGDVIKIRLDLVNYELSFYKNGVNQGVAYRDIGHGYYVSYRLAISQRREDSSVTLLGFTKYENAAEHKEIIDSLEEKLEKERKLRKRTVERASEFEDQKRELQRKIDDLLKKQKQLQSKNSTLLNELTFKSTISGLPFRSSLLTPWNYRTPWFKKLDLDDVKQELDVDKNNLSVMRYVKDPNEGCWHMMQLWKNGDITRYNFLQIMGCKLAKSGFESFAKYAVTGFGGLVGGLFGGFAWGIVGIALGFLLGKLAGLAGEWMWKKIYIPELTNEQKLFKESLELLGFEKEDIYYPHKFNEKLIKKKFNELARKGDYRHPDKGGKPEKFKYLLKAKDMLMDTYPNKKVGLVDSIGD
eukprot:65802_1